MEFVTKTEEETENIGEMIGQHLQTGVVIGLIGDLGAGKTAFSRGLARGIGVKAVVNSPTFVVMKVYEVIDNVAITNLVHIDAYRLSGSADLEAIGVFDYFERSDSVVIIEWANMVLDILPNNRILINLTSINEIERKIVISENFSL